MIPREIPVKSPWNPRGIPVEWAQAAILFKAFKRRVCFPSFHSSIFFPGFFHDSSPIPIHPALRSATGTLHWDVLQLQAARSKPILHMNRLAAENPVWLVSACWQQTSPDSPA